MLTSWRIKNFKAWQDTGTIKLAPLTVFFGENSVGKSSLGQLLLALKQTVQSSTVTQPLDFGNAQSLIDLGGFAQNLHQGQLDKPLEFELHWQLAPTLKLKCMPEQAPIILDSLQLWVSFVADLTQQPQVDFICYKGLQKGEELLQVSYSASDKDTLLVQIRQHCERIPLAAKQRVKRFDQLPVTEDSAASWVHSLAAQTAHILTHLHSLAALRVAPKRRYIWQGDTPADVGRDGRSAVAAILAAGAEQRTLQVADELPEQSLQQAVAYWLKQIGVATDFSVQLVAQSIDNYCVVLKNHREASAANLMDVGFGISQLLPIIVQIFYAQPHSTVWLEQPEIHLHSHVQAGLADLLIAGVQAKQNHQARNVQIIVESHSEHFLNRLQRRIAEGVISHEDVALYFCSRNEEQETHIEALNVDTYGEISNWPTNLFGDEMTDIAARAMAAVRRKRQDNASGVDDV